jgi:hypothetical protein
MRKKVKFPFERESFPVKKGELQRVAWDSNNLNFPQYPHAVVKPHFKMLITVQPGRCVLSTRVGRA